MRNVSDKSVKKITTHIEYSIISLLKLCRLRNTVEKYGRAGQATDDNAIWRKRFACWITKATNINSGYAILIAFAPQK